jgi:hypothetical protein
VLVVVGVRRAPDFSGAVLADPPGGRWRDVLRGEERSFDAGAPVARVVGEHGVAVFERL